jgi:hypothetical protein
MAFIRSKATPKGFFLIILLIKGFEIKSAIFALFMYFVGQHEV